MTGDIFPPIQPAGGGDQDERLRRALVRVSRLRRRRRLVGAAVAAVVAVAVGVPLTLASGHVRTSGVEVATGSSTTGPGTPTPSTPRVTVSPDTGLVGGQKVLVTVSGFPDGTTVQISECAGPTPPSQMGQCDQPGTSASAVYTAGGQSRSVPFVAAPSLGGVGGSASTVCRDQCLMVAVVVKTSSGLPANPPPSASTPLSFATHGSGGLANTTLTDLTWVSATNGWALAARPCSTGTCARLAHTTDGGTQWQVLPDPPASVSEDASGGACPTSGPCVRSIRFATSQIGYLFGPDLLMTTDGGRTWTPQAGVKVEALAIDGGRVLRVAYDHSGCPGPCHPVLQESPIGSTAWSTLVGSLAYPGRSNSAQIVVSGSSALVAFYGSQAGPVSARAVLYRSTDSATTWTRQTDPCPSGTGPQGEVDLVGLASGPNGLYGGLCRYHLQTSGAFVITSTDAARSWTRSAPLPSQPVFSLVAVPNPSTLVAATGSTGGSGSYTATLLISSDAGKRWTTAATDPQQLTQTGSPAWLGFENPQVGHWVGDPHDIFNTSDGGQHWTRLPFP